MVGLFNTCLLKNRKKHTGSHAGAGFFPIHSDGAHLPNNKLIDIVMLLTLCNRKTKSILVSYKILEKILRKKLDIKFDVLKYPRFEFSTSMAYDKVIKNIAPIITLDTYNKSYKWRIQGNRHLLKAAYENDYEAKKVLEILFQVLHQIKPCHCFAMEYGDLLLIDNVRGYIHTRQPINTRSSYESRRHLMRTHGRFRR